MLGGYFRKPSWMGRYDMSVYSYCGKYIYIKPSMGAGWVGWVVMLCRYIVSVANVIFEDEGYLYTQYTRLSISYSSLYF